MTNREQQIKKEAVSIFGRKPGMGDAEQWQDIIGELKSLDPKEVSDDLRFIYDALDQVDESIEEEKKSYGLYDVDREKMESLYGIKMDILYNLSFVFHPFTSYGRNCVEKAVNTRKDYEKLGECLTTRIDADNINVFMPVLPDDIVEEIVTGRRQALGAIRSIKQVAYAAGAIVYWLDTETQEDSPILRIEWLYVHPDFRGRRIADSLIGELVYQMHKNDIEVMTASFAVGSTWEPLMGSIFSHWRFGFGGQMAPDTVILPGDVTELDELKKKSDSVNPLSGMDEHERMQFIRRSLTNGKYTGYLWDVLENKDYFDPEISCYTGDRSSPSGVMLMHRTPSDDYRVEYVSADDEAAEEIISMCAFVISQSVARGHSESLIDFSIRMDELWEYLDLVIPKQKSALLVTGVLTGVSDETDINETMIDRLLSATDSDLQTASKELATALGEVRYGL
ncbi:MAG: GNAT family N-acetyltransferase [Lachnospiraceae bacterium]|nr:GNAT family N-acetyltransferase [Lachnospiraceae bacterium]